MASMNAKGHVERRRIVRWLQPLTVRPRSLDKRAQVRADPRDIAEAPLREVDQMDARAAR
jgi:hypothetical protein